MAKVLFLIRHAESLESGRGQKDKDRILSPTGYQDAPRVGQYLYNQHCRPDIMIASDAERARITALLIAEQLKFERHKILLEEDVYKASVRSLLELINNQKEAYEQVMIIGHNPVVTYLAEYLTRKEIGSMAPCSVARLSCESDNWKGFSEGNVDLLAYITPELVKGNG